MSSFIQTAIPYHVVASHVLLVFMVITTIWRKSWSKEFAFFGKYALSLSLLVAFGAVAGSLFYSEIVGYPPCVLCWWQRVFLYPTLPLFAVALWKRDYGVFKYTNVLAIIAGVFALYHSYVYWGGKSLLPCTALGGACSKIYVYAMGYITIPSMSLTIVVYLLVLAWINKLYRNENRNA